MNLKFTYRNHRETINERNIELQTIRWEEGNSDYKHPHGYVIHGYDWLKDAPRSFLFQNVIPKPEQNVLIDFTQLIDKQSIKQLVEVTEALVKAVRYDMYGSVVGRFHDGNGGLTSNDTLKAADAVERLLNFYK